MSMKMSNAPVYYALVQARFNPVTTIGTKYINDIQDAFRLMGYTLFEPQEKKQLQFTAIPGQVAPEPKIDTLTFWLITKSDRSSGFILDQSSLTFHTTHYVTKNKFIPVLLDGLKEVHKIVNLEHISRLGLRYLDAVIPTGKDSIEDYLSDGLHGIKFGDSVRYSLHESVFETNSDPKSTLIARVHRANGILGYPPDITPSGLVPMTRFNREDKVTHAVIDTDHFSEYQYTIKIDFKKLKTQLESLHEGITKAFEAITTEHARATWK